MVWKRLLFLQYVSSSSFIKPLICSLACGHPEKHIYQLSYSHVVMWPNSDYWDVSGSVCATSGKGPL